MAPGPKKKSFHTPRNAKNVQNLKTNDKKNVELSNELNKNVDTTASMLVDSESSENKKYSKRSVESNWTKYEEPQVDPHADSTRGNDFEVLLSYSGGSGSQLKLQDEKDWECENMKDISLNFQNLINSMKCIPFHERINIQNIFDEKQVNSFISIAEKWKTNYKSQPKCQAVESKDLQTPDADLVLTIVEEQPDSLESDDITLKNFRVTDKTEDIINTLASNLTFKVPEKVVEIPVEEKKPEAASNDLDFLLSLNISSKVTVKEEITEVSKAPNVDDWLNSILDD